MSRRTSVGRTIGDEAALAIDGEGIDRAEVFWLEIWKIGQDVGFSHSGGEVAEHVGDRDPQAANTRLPVALDGLDGDSPLIGHYLD
jgi:hypothetical protein